MIKIILILISSFSFANDLVYDIKDYSKKLAQDIKEYQLKNNLELKIAVLDFSYLDNNTSIASIKISDSFTVNLAKNNITILERNILDKLFKEKKLQRTGAFDDKTIMKLTNLIGANAVLTGTIEDLDNDRTKINIRLIGSNSVIIIADEIYIKRDWEKYNPQIKKPDEKQKIVSEIKFEIEKLPDVKIPKLELKEINMSFDNMDIEKLEKYNEMVNLEKNSTDYILISKKWEEFANLVPEYYSIATQRAKEIKNYYEELVKYEETKKQIKEQMNKDYNKLIRILKLDVITADKKDDFAWKFIQTYKDYDFDEFKEYYENLKNKYLLRGCINPQNNNFALCYSDGSYKFLNLPYSIARDGFSIEGFIVIKKCDYYDTNQEECFRFMDRDGKVYGKYKNARNFKNGLAAVQESYSNNWGFINNKFEYVIKPEYDEVGDFNSGLIYVKKNDKYGFIDNKNNVVIPFKYDLIYDAFEYAGEDNDIAKVGIKDNKGNCKDYTINKKDVIINTERYYYFLPDFRTKHNDKYLSMQQLKKNKKYGVIDSDENIFIPFKYDSLEKCSNGFYLFSLNNMYGFLDENGKEIIKNKYYGATCFEDGLSWVYNDNELWGAIDEKENIVIPFKYETINNFNNGVAAVQIKGKWVLINKKANTITETNYDNIYNTNEKGLFYVEKNKKHGLIDYTGKIIIPLKYDEIGSFNNKIAYVKINNKYGFINDESKEITPLKYDKALSLDSDFPFLGINLFNKEGYVDNWGREIFFDNDKDFYSKYYSW